ncbi:MAG: hypothetical protein ACK2TV_08535 [Anaerolineales bacterium]
MPRVEEKICRHGFITLTSVLNEGQWWREVEEFTFDEEVFEEIIELRVASLSELREIHKESIANRQLEFGLDFPIQLESDGNNRNLGLAVEERSSENFPAPIECNLLYLPTVLPNIVDRSLNQPTWELIRVKYGFGEFPITYSASLVSSPSSRNKISVLMDGSEQIARGENVALIMTPKGEINFEIPTDGCIPISGNGSIEIRVHAFGVNDGIDIDMTLLDYKTSFEWRQIPGTFDKKTLRLGGRWPK